jgi:CheY-like chemotaxis protein
VHRGCWITLDGNQQVAGALRQGTKPTALFCAWNDFVKIVTDFNAMVVRLLSVGFFVLVSSVTCGRESRQVNEKRKDIFMVATKSEGTTVPLHTVLIISDQPDNVALWDTLFNQRNCIVLAEANIHDALQTARLVGPSLMLVDIKLSKTERASLLNGLRTASRGPILMTISANTVDDIMEANKAGADECLIKPVNPAVLLVKAMAWLGQGEKSSRFPAGLNQQAAA